MKLLGGFLSPFARKVRVLAHETGQTLEIERQSSTPTERNPVLAEQNPLGKIPVLIGPDGPLYDSRVICQYLDSLHDGVSRYGAGAARWDVLRREALGDGLTEAALLARYESVRPEAFRWPDWIEGQLAKVRAALAVMAAEARDPGPAPDMGAIAWGCALGYLDVRFPDLGWREAHPRLAEWEAALAARPAFQATRPPADS